jgi:hypothetical protein
MAPFPSKRLLVILAATVSAFHASPSRADFVSLDCAAEVQAKIGGAGTLNGGQPKANLIVLSGLTQDKDALKFSLYGSYDYRLETAPSPDNAVKQAADKGGSSIVNSLIPFNAVPGGGGAAPAHSDRIRVTCTNCASSFGFGDPAARQRSFVFLLANLVKVCFQSPPTQVELVNFSKADGTTVELADLSKLPTLDRQKVSFGNEGPDAIPVPADLVKPAP